MKKANIIKTAVISFAMLGFGHSAFAQDELKDMPSGDKPNKETKQLINSQLKSFSVKASYKGSFLAEERDGAHNLTKNAELIYVLRTKDKNGKPIKVIVTYGFLDKNKNHILEKDELKNMNFAITASFKEGAPLEYIAETADFNSLDDMNEQSETVHGVIVYTFSDDKVSTEPTTQSPNDPVVPKMYIMSSTASAMLEPKGNKKSDFYEDLVKHIKDYSEIIGQKVAEKREQEKLKQEIQLH